MASSAISIDTIRQSIGGGFGVTAPGPDDGDTSGGEDVPECGVKIDSDKGNIVIGNGSDTSSANAEHEIVIGNGATGMGGNTIQLGRNDYMMKLYCGDKEVAFKSDITGSSVKIDNDGNARIGHNVLPKFTGGKFNIAIGDDTMRAFTGGDGNIAIGYSAASNLEGGVDNILIGVGTETSSKNAMAEIVIGQGATGRGQNTVQFGWNEIEDMRLFCGSREVAFKGEEGGGSGSGDVPHSDERDNFLFESTSSVEPIATYMPKDYNVLMFGAKNFKKGDKNVIIGYGAGDATSNTAYPTKSNVIIGVDTIKAAYSVENSVVIGTGAAASTTLRLMDSILIGCGASVGAEGGRNRIVIGNGAFCGTNNTAQIGRGDTDMTIFCGNKGAVALQSDITSIKTALHNICTALSLDPVAMEVPA